MVALKCVGLAARSLEAGCLRQRAKLVLGSWSVRVARTALRQARQLSGGNDTITTLLRAV